ncbi:MAG: Non-ous end-joining ligase [Actinomycetota bacterium]|nr:Non-ous end-joining ligase [Actinomycetota bacterium]
MSLDLYDDRRLTSEAVGGPDKWKLEVDGTPMTLSNLDRVLYQESGFRKRDLIDYYAAVAPVLLPHLRDRPVTMRRFPDGTSEPGFWEKHCPDYRPDWVETATVSSDSRGGSIEYCLINNLPTLIWMANLASIELHVPLARVETPTVPDSVVFDLDPGSPAGILNCAEIALLINETFERQGLRSFAKISGSKGIQVYLPLNSPDIDFERTGAFAHSLARGFESELPDQVVSRMTRSLRKGKVLIDWSQNSRHKTTVAVYSMRATPSPSVSFPVSWQLLERSLDNDDRSLLACTPDAAIDSLSSGDHPFQPVLETQQKLPG